MRVISNSIYEKALKTMKSKGNSYWKSQFIFRDRIAYFHKWQLGILVRLLKYLLLWIIMVGTYQTTFSYWSHSASNSMYLYYDVCELWSSSNVSWKNRRHRSCVAGELVLTETYMPLIITGQSVIFLTQRH